MIWDGTKHISDFSITSLGYVSVWLLTVIYTVHVYCRDDNMHQSGVYTRLQIVDDKLFMYTMFMVYACSWLLDHL